MKAILLFVSKLSMLAYFAISSRSAHAQTGPLRFRSPFLESNSDTVYLHSNHQMPDSAEVSFSRLDFCLEDKAGSRSTFLFISNSGGILAFSDSLMKKPFLLEKRNGYPFRRFLPSKDYLLIFTKKPGAGDYLGFRILEKPDNSIYDEVLLCSYGDSCKLSFSGTKGWLKQR